MKGNRKILETAEKTTIYKAAAYLMDWHCSVNAIFVIQLRIQFILRTRHIFIVPDLRSKFTKILFL